MVARSAAILGEESLLERAHRGLFGRLGVVPAAQMEHAVGHEEPELVDRRPADVAGLAAPAGLGLADRALDRDRDVADVDASAVDPSGPDRDPRAATVSRTW